MLIGVQLFILSVFHCLISAYLSIFESVLNHFILYSRSYCHLCDDMLIALQALSAEFSFDVSVVDVDADTALVAQYDELVPVLLGRKAGRENTVQLCHYFFDVNKVRAFLLENKA